MTKASVWLATGFGGPEVLSRAEADVAPPGPGEVTIGVRAAGVNPADYKHFAPGQDPGALPLRIGYEVAGVITALGPGTELASGGGRTGDEVIASLVDGGDATALTVPAPEVFPSRPASPSRPRPTCCWPGPRRPSCCTSPGSPPATPSWSTGRRARSAPARCSRPGRWAPTWWAPPPKATSAWSGSWAGRRSATTPGWRNGYGGPRRRA